MQKPLMFYGRANSIFYGCKLLTTPNPDTHERCDVILKNWGSIQPQTRGVFDEAHQAALLDENKTKSTVRIIFMMRRQRSYPVVSANYMAFLILSMRLYGASPTRRFYWRKRHNF